MIARMTKFIWKIYRFLSKISMKMTLFSFKISKIRSKLPIFSKKTLDFDVSSYEKLTSSPLSSPISPPKHAYLSLSSHPNCQSAPLSLRLLPAPNKAPILLGLSAQDKIRFDGIFAKLISTNNLSAKDLESLSMMSDQYMEALIREQIERESEWRERQTEKHMENYH
jgi:hypothetical protein